MANTDDFPTYLFRTEVAPDVDGSVPASWTDLGSQISLESSGGDRPQGSVKVNDRTGAVVQVGRKESITLDLKMLYQNEAGDAFVVLRGYFDADTKFWVRFTPVYDSTASATNDCIHYGPGKLLELSDPKGDTGSNEPSTIAGKFSGALRAFDTYTNPA